MKKLVVLLVLVAFMMSACSVAPNTNNIKSPIEEKNSIYNKYARD